MNGTTGNVKFIYTDKSTETQATTNRTSIVFGEDGSLWAQGMQYIPANAQFTDTSYNTITLSELEGATSETGQLISANILNQAYNISNQTITIGATSITVPITELSSNYETSTDLNDDLLLAEGDTYEEAFGKLEKNIVDNEKLLSLVSNDLNDRILDIDNRIDNIHIPVTSVNGMTGAVTISYPVTSVNGMTGAVTINSPVTSVNGMTGAVTISYPVTSVNGMTGAVIISNELSPNYEKSSDSNEDLLLDGGDTYEEAFAKIEKAIIDNEETVAASINDISQKVELNYSQLASYINNVEYVKNDKKIYFKNNNITLAEINASDFIKDGMVNSVTIDTPTSGTNANVECLIISFNTDAGQSPIEIPLTSIFDTNNYYTKSEIGNAKIFKGTCSTTAATAVKEVVCTEFTSADLVTGALIFVTFTATNSAAVANLQMNVNSTGDMPLKRMFYNETPRNFYTAGELIANQTYLFQYDGTNWVCMTADTNTTYSQLTLAALQGGTATTSRLISANVLNQAYNISNQTITIGATSITVPITELSSNYETSTDLNDDLLLAEGDTYEEAFGKLEKAIIDNEEVAAGSINYLNRQINNLNNSIVNVPNIPITSADNGKILMVVNGQWQLVSPSVLYSGQGTPNNANGNNGDLYIQTD